MRTLHAITLAALVCVGVTALPEAADARDRWDKHHHHHHGGHHHHHDRWEDWDNRRDARRAGVIAGAAAAGIAGAVARDNARDHYEECMNLYAYNRRYERYCREEYYYDSRRANRAARRTGVVVGLGVREIVRD